MTPRGSRVSLALRFVPAALFVQSLALVAGAPPVLAAQTAGSDQAVTPVPSSSPGTALWQPRPVWVFMAAHSRPQAPAFVSEADGLGLSGRATAVVQGGTDLRIGELPGLRTIARHWTAEVEMRGEAHEGGTWRARFWRAALQRDGDRHQATVGRAPLRWTHAPSGRSLLYGRSAPPRWHVGWNTARPLDLPWLPPQWGTWSGGLFLAYLDDTHRVIANPLLFGHRLSWQPAPWFEVSGTRTILFGGDGRTKRLTLGALWDILAAQNENIRGDRPPSDSDQRASLSLRLRPVWITERVGPLQRLELFYEYGGEDMLHPPIPSAVAHHYGGSAELLGWELAGEFAETVTGSNRWYFHTVYKDAYFYQGFPLGLPQVSDARSVRMLVRTPEGPVRGHLAWNEELFGVRRGNRELRVRWEATVQFAVHRRATVALGFARTDRRSGGEEPRAPGFAPTMVTLELIRL